MSRLYAWIVSDLLKKTATIRANEILNITINYGSEKDSKRLFRVNISFPKGSDKPKIEVI